MSIQVIDKIKPLGDFPIADAENIDINGSRLDVVLAESAQSLSSKASKNYVDEQVASIPKVTKTSQLQNDSGFLTHHQSLTDYVKTTDERLTNARPASDVKAWAKADSKPSYTAAEIGALPSSTVVPSKTSQLQNDSGFLTEHQDISGKAEKTTVEQLMSKVGDVESEQTTLSARMDTFTMLPDGSTAGNAELTDIRVGANGKTYENAGSAVRTQITNIDTDLSGIKSGKYVLNIPFEYVSVSFKIYKGVTYEFNFSTNTGNHAIKPINEDGTYGDSIVEHPNTTAVWTADKDYKGFRTGGGGNGVTCTIETNMALIPLSNRISKTSVYDFPYFSYTSEPYNIIKGKTYIITAKNSINHVIKPIISEGNYGDAILESPQTSMIWTADNNYIGFRIGNQAQNATCEITDGIEADIQGISGSIATAFNEEVIDFPFDYTSVSLNIKKGVTYTFEVSENTGLQSIKPIISDGNYGNVILEHPNIKAIWTADADYIGLRIGGGSPLVTCKISHGICESVKNKTQVISAGSTEVEYPSAKAVFDFINNSAAVDAVHISVGSGKTFTKLEDALESITDNSASKRYVIDVYPGTYSVPSGEKYFGLKNFVDIKGINKATCIITNIHETGYNAEYAGFDPQKYSQAIMHCRISNLTIKTKGGKCPIHIDTDYSHFASGGKIVIDNCLLFDLNAVSSANENRGGINVGLRDNQTVEVYNTFANGAIYAHTTANQSTKHGCKFHVENCTMAYWSASDLLDNTNADIYELINCNVNYLRFFANRQGTMNGVYSIMPIIKGCTIGLIELGDSEDKSVPYKLNDNFFGGRYAFPIEGYHEAAYANSISRGTLVSCTYSHDREFASCSVPENSMDVYLAVESSHDGMTTIQKKGRAFCNLQAVTSKKSGDYIGYVNGSLAVVDKSNVRYIRESNEFSGFSIIEFR